MTSAPTERIRSAAPGRPLAALPVVHPTNHDKVATAASEVAGGPAGRRILDGTGLVGSGPRRGAVALGMFALGMLQKLPCFDGAWFSGQTSQYVHACYSDIPHLYNGRGFATGSLRISTASLTASPAGWSTSNTPY